MDPAETVAGAKSRRTFWIAASVLLALSAVIRLAAMFGDLAIDEIWSWALLNYMRRPIDVLAIKHDNNHPFNTLVMYLIGPNAAGVWYRVPAVLASVVTVALAGLIASRRPSAANPLLAMLLVGGSYLMILYGCEARGYAYALCFAFLCWELLLRTASGRRWIDPAGAAVAACLGLLSHLTFIYALAGFWVWAVLLWTKQPAWRAMLALLAPTAFAGFLYLAFINGMAIGGGPELPLFMAIVQSLSISAGGPLFGDGALAAALIFTVLVGIGLWKRSRSSMPEAGGMLAIIFVAPALVLMSTGHALIYPRYFFVPIGFALLLVADVLADAWRRSGWRRLATAALMVAYFAGNAWWTIRLLDHGRGDYTGALQWMADQMEAHPAAVQADHDFRIGLIYGYYAPRMGLADNRLRYVPQNELQPAGTAFYVRHDFEGDDPFPDLQLDRYGNRYRLERVFRHQSLSGYNWWVYRRERK